MSTLGAPAAFAAEAPVGLGTARTFDVLGGQSVTNTGPSILGRDLGVSPGTAVNGFPPGLVQGAIHAADAVALQAQSDLTVAYNDAAGRAATANIANDLGGLTLGPGVYKASSSIGLTGTLTLDAQGDPDSVFVFQIGSALTTASASTVALINGARQCNVFWQIGSSATLGTSSSFVGTIMALTSISVTTGTTVRGRALARNGSVTLDDNVFTSPRCARGVTPTDGSTTVPPTTPATDTPPTSSGTDDTTGPTDSTTTAGGPEGSGPTTGSGGSEGNASAAGNGSSAANGSGAANGSSGANGSGDQNGSGDTSSGGGAGGEDVGGGSELTRTGASGVNSLIGVGALLLVAGGVLIAWMRRRAGNRGSH